MTEAQLQQDIRVAISQIDGCVVLRNNTGRLQSGNRYVQFGLGKGSFDLICCVCGRFVALEVKTPTGRVSKDQEMWQAKMRRVGAVAEVVRSVAEAKAIVRSAKMGGSFL